MKYLSAPDTVSWEITERCNLKCEHCSNAIDGYAYQAPLCDCKKIIDTLSSNKVFRLNIEGGEPFVRPDLIEIIKYANQNYLWPKIDTNGTLIDKNIAHELAECHLRGVQISLDGPTAESYAKVRKSRQAFIDTIHGIEELKRVGVHVGISMVLMKSNIKYIDDYFALADNLMVDSVRFVDFIPTGRGSFDECISAEQIRDAYSKIKEYSNAERRYAVIYPSKITGLLNSRHSSSSLMKLNSNYCMACEAGTVLMHIRANGDVTPCVYFRDKQFVAGNIISDSFSDIWNNSLIMKKFRELGSLSDKCLNCQNILNCMGGCRAYAYYKSKKHDIKAFDERCWKTNDDV